MQIDTFDEIKVEYHKAITSFVDIGDMDSYHIIGITRKESPDGTNVMIENIGLAIYDNQYDAEVIANKIADALGIDYTGIRDFLTS